MKKIKVLCIILLLVSIDQALKLFAAQFMDREFVLIQNTITIRVVQNIHLNWIAHRTDFMMPLSMAIGLNIVWISFLIIGIRYFAYCTSNWKKYTSVLTVSFILGISGSICAFIDHVLWGGSIDYILLFDWPIFDLKDLYILFAIITIIFYYFAYRLLHFRKLSKKEQKRITDEEKFLYWVKCGLPLKQKT